MKPLFKNKRTLRWKTDQMKTASISRSQWVAQFTTDLSLSIEQMIEFYGARWKIESGFKEIEQDIGTSSSQMRNAQSLMNHLNFCMMAAAVTWLYAIRLENTPDHWCMI